MEIGTYNKTTNKVTIFNDVPRDILDKNVGVILNSIFDICFSCEYKQYNKDIYCHLSSSGYIYVGWCNNLYSAYESYKIYFDTPIDLTLVKNEIIKNNDSYNKKIKKSKISVYESELNNLYMQCGLMEIFDVVDMDMRRCNNAYYTYIKTNKYDTTFRCMISKNKKVGVIVNFRSIVYEDIKTLCHGHKISQLSSNSAMVCIQKQELSGIIDILRIIVAYLENI